MKRLFDFVMSLIGIIVLSPIILIVALAVKLTSPGPMLFKQRRIGKNNDEFQIYKFRTMRIDTPNVPTHLLENPEQWITPVGKFLRKTSLDELPQLFNILKGDMTIVGPRPIVIDELEFYGECEDYYKAVKPGLTGLWQVSGRSDTTYDERVNLDMEYVTTRNTFKDLYIIFMTAVKVLKREGSY